MPCLLWINVLHTSTLTALSCASENRTRRTASFHSRCGRTLTVRSLVLYKAYTALSGGFNKDGACHLARRVGYIPCCSSLNR